MVFQADVSDLALPLGSLILVTGATGFIATHIVNEVLKAGYKVRGTARSADKAKDDESYHGNENYSCVVVEDLVAANAFDNAVKNCNGVIHCASPTDLNPDPHKVITGLIASIHSILESCVAEPTIKRFVYTSSSTAACLPVPGRPGHLDRHSWNDEAVKIAWEEPHVPAKAYPVYGASKTQAERAMWEFARTKKPNFVINSLLPDTNFGRILNGRAGPTAKTIVDLYLKNYLPTYIPSQYMVNVQDTAKLHLIALVDPVIKDERIYAWDEIFTWNAIIDIISEARPKDAARLQGLKLKDEVSDATTVDNALGGELLKKWYKQDGAAGKGWVGLKQTIIENLEGVPEYQG